MPLKSENQKRSAAGHPSQILSGNFSNISGAQSNLCCETKLSAQACASAWLLKSAIVRSKDFKIPLLQGAWIGME